MRLRSGTMGSAAAALGVVIILAGCGSTVAGTAAPVSFRSSPQPSSPVHPTSAAAIVPSTTDGTTPSDALTSADPPTSAESTTPAATSSAATSSAPPASGSSAGRSVDPAAFAARLQKAAATVESVVGTIQVTSSPSSVQGNFSEVTSGGKVTAVDMTMFVAVSGRKVAVKVRIVGGKAYVGGDQLLTAVGAGNKQWALVNAKSSNSTLRGMAGQLDGYLNSASTDQYTGYALAAKNVVDQGPDRMGTTPTEKYRVDVDVAAAARSMKGSAGTSMESLVAAGMTTLPVTLSLDSSNRVVQSITHLEVRGVTSDTIFRVTRYDSPVSIKVPSAAEVFTG